LTADVSVLITVILLGLSTQCSFLQGDVNIQSNFKWNNWTALMTACYYGNAPLVEALINANANLDLLDVSGNTALQLALENENIECLQIILNEKGSY